MICITVMLSWLKKKKANHDRITKLADKYSAFVTTKPPTNRFWQRWKFWTKTPECERCCEEHYLIVSEVH